MKVIKVGIFGARRGADFIKNLMANNGEIVAVCDRNEKFLKNTVADLPGDVAAYTDAEEFLNHPMDAVILANYFTEHTKYAIRFLEKGIHVLCECLSNVTMAEGVQLVRAAEKSKAHFMLAENYVYMLFNQEMKKVYDGGTLGKVLYAEGEYNHPANAYDPASLATLINYEKHWRNYLPRTYYITHSLGPIMYITGSQPVKVTAMPIYSPSPDDCCRVGRVPEAASVITILNDDHSVFKVTGHASFGARADSYRVCGQKGMIENIRGTDGMVMLRYNDWDIPEGREAVNYYKPGIIDKDADIIAKAGHGGGDYYICREFLNAIRNDTGPDLDVYYATTLSSVAIMAHRSTLAGGVPQEIPDFRKEEDRVKFENDTASPFWLPDGTPPSMPCTVFEDYAPSAKQIENFHKELGDDEVKW